MHRYAAGTIALLCCTALFVGGIAAADGGYDISIAGSVDTPDRVVTLEGNEYTVSAIGVVNPGEAIQVSVDAPAGTEYDLYLYNDDRQQQDRINNAGASATFDGDYPAGSYMVAVYADGNFVTVHPVVVSSYHVTVDAPNTVEPGSEVEVGVTVETVDGTPENLDAVQVVVSKDGEDETLTASKSGEGTYTATTTLSETGDYLVYANVRGTETSDGQRELLGVSQATTVTVRDPTPTATPTQTDSSGGGDPNPSTDTATATQTVTATATERSTATATATTTATATSDETATSTATATIAPATATSTPDNVLTPNPNTSTTTGSLSGLIPVVAVVGFGLLARRQR